MTDCQLPNQILTITLLESGEHVLAAFRQVAEKQSFLLTTFIGVERNVDDFAGEWVATGMIDTGGQAARGWG